MMSEKLYIAGTGMITPVGANTTMTAAAINAGISAYSQSEYYDQVGRSITMASVPDNVFDEIDAEIGEGDRYNSRHDRVIKMAIIAIREACAQHKVKQAVPLILAMPDGLADPDDKRLSPLIDNLEHNCAPWVNAKQCRTINSGRAAGIEAIDFAFNYLNDTSGDFILIGGSDSHQDDSRLNPLSEAGRLLVTGSMDSFAPGEGAGFLLLTQHPGLAQVKNGHIIAIHPPGVTEELGHLHSKETYRGDGLDQAFKKALKKIPGNPAHSNIHSIYSSMNGENHWAKEYGVAYLRNKVAFLDEVKIEHPADAYGDLGAATSTVLIALAAQHLHNNAHANSHLVYSSSDHAKRGAIVIQKIVSNQNPAANQNTLPLKNSQEDMQ